MDIRNGVTHRRLSQVMLEKATRSYASVGRMPQEANAWGNAQDMLTWGGYTGRHRYQADEGLMAGVFDVLKTAEYNQSFCHPSGSGVKP